MEHFASPRSQKSDYSKQNNVSINRDMQCSNALVMSLKLYYEVRLGSQMKFYRLQYNGQTFLIN